MISHPLFITLDKSHDKGMIPLQLLKCHDIYFTPFVLIPEFSQFPETCSTPAPAPFFLVFYCKIKTAHRTGADSAFPQASQGKVSISQHWVLIQDPNVISNHSRQTNHIKMPNVDLTPHPRSLEWRLLGVLGNEVRSDYRLAASKEKQLAKRARIEIAKATDLEERTIGTEPTIKQVETVHDLWQAFGWSQATKKKLPNEDLRKGDVLLKESGGSGWSTMVQSVLAAVVRCAEILYPANSDSLLEEVAARLSQSSSSITTKDENRVTGRAYLEPYKKDIKRMFERGARVSSDKMSPCAMLEELQSLYLVATPYLGRMKYVQKLPSCLVGRRPVMRTMQGSDHNESENEATKGRGSNLPKQYVKHLEELVERKSHNQAC
eukprot:Em0006g1188a